MAERDVTAEMEALKSDLAKLRADMAGLATAAKSAGKAEAAALKESAGNIVENLREQITAAYDEAKAKGKKGVEVVEHGVAEHPFVTIVAAFGVGFLLAKLLDRNRS